MDSIPIPAVRIEPVATEAASGAKTVAGVLGFLFVVFGIAAIGMVTEGTGDALGKKDNPMEVLVGISFWMLLIGFIAFRFYRNARHATAAAKAATTDPAYTWFLSGKLIVAANAAGAPHPELSFKLTKKLRTMLLAVPRAHVVDSAR